MTDASATMPGTPQDGRLFVAVLVQSLHRFGDRLLFDQPDDERSFTYRQAAARVAQIMGVLDAHGIGRHAGVGVLTTNCPEGWMVAVAPQIAGGYYSALPMRASVDDLVYMIQKGELQCVVVHPDLAALGAEVVERCGDLKAVFSLGPSDLAPDLLALADEISARPLTAAPGIQPEDLCHLWYTGGTTGRPKAAMHTQRSVLGSVLRYLTGYGLVTPIRYAALGPLSHSGYPQCQPTLMSGGSVTVIRAFDPLRFAQLTAEKRLNTSSGVPTMLYALLDVAERESVDMPSMKAYIYGGSPIAPDRMRQLQDRFGRVFSQMYGTSESIGSGTCLLPEEHDPDDPDRLLSCGRVVPGVQLALLDDELQPVAPGEVGEMCVRSASMMAGYWKEPEMTADAFAGGWFHTGDLGRVDDEGFHTLVDRKKDMIISGGFNVYPVEIENILMTDPTIHLAAVIGVPDPKWGEAVRAVVVPAKGATIDAQAIMSLIREKKGAVYAPKAVDVVDDIPLTPAGKVDKKALREPYWAGEVRRIH